MRQYLRWMMVLALFVVLLFGLVACKNKEKSELPDDLSASTLALNIGDYLRERTGITKVEINEDTGAVLVVTDGSLSTLVLSDLQMPYYKSIKYSFYSDGDCTNACDEITITEEGVTVYVKAIVKPETFLIQITFKRAEATPAHTHEYGDWVVVTSPTCILPGTKKRICSCGEQEIDAIPALGHDLRHYDRKEATCTEPGWAEHDSCTRCDYTTDATVYPAIGHHIVDGVCTICLKEDFFNYSILDNGTYAITGYTAETPVLTLPSTYREVAVTEIAEHAFHNSNYLLEVVIPEGIVRIGDYAFSNSSNLKKITLPHSLTVVDNSAFYSCEALKGVYYQGDITSWCEITFGRYGYARSNPLYYAEALYFNGSPVTEVAIPDTITEVGRNAFSGWNGTKITLPSTITKIGDDAFKECYALTSVYYQGDITSWCEITFENYDSNPLRFAGSLYIDGSLVTEIVIPDTITILGRYTFSGWNGTNVTMPTSIEQLSNDCFSYCVGLDEISYVGTTAQWAEIRKDGWWDRNTPNYYIRCSNGIERKHIHTFEWVLTEEATCTSMGMEINRCSVCGFYYENRSIEKTAHDYSAGDTCAVCGKRRGLGYTPLLTEYYDDHTVVTYGISEYDGEYETLVIPAERDDGSAVTEIGESAFADNTTLTTVIIPASITRINKKAFENCTSLSVIIFGGTMSQWNAIEKDGEDKWNRSVDHRTTYSPGSFIIYPELAAPNYLYETEEKTWDFGTEYYAIHCADGVIEKHIHDYEYVTIQESTCNQTGKKVLRCSVCGKEGGESQIEKSNVHNYNAENVCTLCGHIKGLGFSMIETYASVDYYDGEDRSVVIPSEYQGVPVRSIDSDAFAYKASLESVTIPRSVTQIKSNAFAHSRALREIVYQGTLAEWEEIGKYDKWDDYTESKTLVCSDQRIENYHDHIYVYTIISRETASEGYFLVKRACAKCDLEEEVKIGVGSPNGSEIQTESSEDGFVYYYDEEQNGYEIMSYSGTCTDVVIPESYKGKPVVSLGSVFDYNTAITSISIPAGVTELSDTPFCGCTELVRIVVAEGNAAYRSVDGVLFNREMTRIIRYPSAKVSKSYAIPEGVTEIGAHAFYCCEGLYGVTIPDSVKEIEYSSFYDCSNLFSVTIGSGVEEIGNSAFSNCSRLAEVCNRSSLTLTKGDWGNGAVACYALEVYVGSHPSKVSIDENGYVLLTDEGVVTLLGYVGTETRLVIPDGIKYIAPRAFVSNDSIVSVTIPRSVRKIDDEAFSYCYALAEVYNYSFLSISKGKTDHGYVAYYAKEVYVIPTESDLSEESGFVIHRGEKDVTLVKYTGNALELVIPDGVTEILGAAFRGWKGTSISLPASVKAIGANAFGNCIELKKVSYRGTLADWLEIDFDGTFSNPTYFAHCLYIGDTPVTDVVIPDGITKINAHALRGLADVTTITFPVTLSAITNGTFCDCEKIAKVFYRGDLKDWCRISFGGSTANPLCFGASLYLAGDREHAVTELVIPRRISSIGKYQFYKGAFSKVILSPEVMEICDDAFSGSTIREVVFAEEGPLWAIWSGAFSYCQLESVTIPASVRKIGNYAFRGCDSLRAISFEEGSALTRIGTSAFSGCETLESVHLPKSLLSLGDTVFNGCTALSDVTFEVGSELEAIGSNVFYGCAALEELKLPSSLKGLSFAAFDGCESLRKITFAGSREAWTDLRRISASVDEVFKRRINGAWINIISVVNYFPDSLGIPLFSIFEYDAESGLYVYYPAQSGLVTGMIAAYEIVCSDGVLTE